MKCFQRCYLLGNLHNKTLENISLTVSSLRAQVLVEHNSGFGAAGVPLLRPHRIIPFARLSLGRWLLPRAIARGSLDRWVGDIPEALQNAKCQEQRKCQRPHTCPGVTSLGPRTEADEDMKESGFESGSLDSNSCILGLRITANTFLSLPTCLALLLMPFTCQLIFLLIATS